MDRAEVENRLAGFAGHLLKNRLADEKHGRYMVGWVRRFLASSPPVPNATPDERLQANVETTMIYTHVAKGLRAPPKSPLDQLG